LKNLKDLYFSVEESVIVTAHRGFSGKYPENTLFAFEKAVEMGVDIVEFDVRGSKDDVPIILHDKTLDRTTDGFGFPQNYTLTDLKKLNASFWDGAHDTGMRLNKAKFSDIKIPTLEETFELLNKKIYMNIQVYTQSINVIQNVIELYDQYNLYSHAFFMLPSFEQADLFRSINSKVMLCVGEAREDLQKHKDFKVDFIQPYKTLINPVFCGKIEEMRLCANMFFSNTEEENEMYIRYGIKGIMTDKPDILINSIKKVKPEN